MWHRPETHEGTHLVKIVPDSFVHTHQFVHLGVDHHLEELGFAVGQPPKRPVKQRPPARIAMTRYPFRHLNKSARHAETRFIHRPGAPAVANALIEERQSRFFPAKFFPNDLFRQVMLCQRSARGSLPTGKRWHESNLLHL